MPEKRLASLDVLRGLTILVMIFVNDLAGVRDAPAWMKHFSPHDGGRHDVRRRGLPRVPLHRGMSIPLAIGRASNAGSRACARSGGTSWSGRWSLLVIGVFMVNAETIPDRGLLPAPRSGSCSSYVGVFLVWGATPRNAERSGRSRCLARCRASPCSAPGDPLPRARSTRLHRDAAAVVGDPRASSAGRTSSRAPIYLLRRNQLPALVGTIPLLYCVFVADAAGAFSGWTWLIGGCRSARCSARTRASRCRAWPWGCVLGAGLAGPGPSRPPPLGPRSTPSALAAAAHLLHAAHGVHRMFIVQQDPRDAPVVPRGARRSPWPSGCCCTGGSTCASRGRLGLLLEPAGQNPLTAYLLAPCSTTRSPSCRRARASRTCTPRSAPLSPSGLCRSVLVAVLVAWLAGRLRRLGLQLAL